MARVGAKRAARGAGSPDAAADAMARLATYVTYLQR
jgi:hypothetical protein